MDTPSYVMYLDLKNFGHISNRDAALTLVSSRTPYGGKSMQARIIDDRSFLSRDVVRAQPGRLSLEQFADLPQASLTLGERILRRLGSDAQARLAFEDHYRGPAAEEMRESLSSFGLNETLYVNALNKISAGSYLSPRTKGNLLFMLFLITGCLGDPRVSVQMVDEFAHHSLSQGLYTTKTSYGKEFPPFAHSQEEDRLGLLRFVDGAAAGSIRPLSTAPEGTVIGALATGPEDINDVGLDVSRRHLRVWRAPDGNWYAQGLGSTNGTVLVSGDTRETGVIEPPRSQRAAGQEYPPVCIHGSDTLCLGASTKFLVMRVRDA